MALINLQTLLFIFIQRENIFTDLLNSNTLVQLKLLRLINKKGVKKKKEAHR